MCEELNIALKITNDCNLRCLYCFQKEKNYDSLLLSQEKLLQFCNITFPYLRKANILFHGGEPAFCGLKNFKRYVDIVKEQAYKNNCFITFSIQTNGTLLNKEFISFLQSEKFQIGISFDGLTNEQTRNSSKQFFKMKKFLDEKGMAYYISFVASGLNYNNLNEEYQEMKNKNINFKILPYEKTKNSPLNLEINLKQYISNMKSLFDLWIEDDKCEIIIDPFRRIIKDYYRGYSEICSNSYCLGKNVCLEPNGNITPCNRICLDQFIYGNVSELKNIKNIFNSEAYNKLAIINKERKSVCKEKCEVYAFCKGGCFLDFYKRRNVENGYVCFSCTSFKEIFLHIKSYIDRNRSFEETNTIKNPTVRNLINFLKYSCF